jgi:hypothetical protein
MTDDNQKQQNPEAELDDHTLENVAGGTNPIANLATITAGVKIEGQCTIREVPVPLSPADSLTKG